MRRSAAAAAVLAAVLVGSFLYQPWSVDGPVLCPLRLTTGLECPGCGLTRSFCATSHGHLTEAFAFHAVGPLLFLAAALSIPVLLTEALRRRRVRWFRRALFSNRIGWALVLLLTANWAFHTFAHIRAGDLPEMLRNSLLWTLVKG